MVKYVVVVGGVISGVGKGVTSASIGKILQEYGYKTTAIKIDPYINYDAGTLRPTEHGEVWVTDDGGEIDQDLGNYERFLGINIPKQNNITTGQVYKKVIDNERSGKYLGKTVQFIPHIPDEIKRRVKEASKGYDACIIEIGGTIGDFENIPFLFAMKGLELESGKENVTYILLVFLPTPSHIDEMKTKPAQQAIRMLNEHAIVPDFIICRAKKKLDASRKNKIQTYANIRSDHVISEPDIDTIYRIPLDLEKEKFGKKILKELHLKPKKKPDWRRWKKLVNVISDHGKKIKIAIVGKYVDLADSYISIKHAIEHAAANANAKVTIDWIDAKKLEENKKNIKELKKYDGIIVPGGFGATGAEGKMKAIQFAREKNIPFLGLCYGLQLAVIEFARNICGMKKANTTENDPKTRYPVIDILPTQKKLIEESKYGGTMRLGAYSAILKDNTKVLDLYKKTRRLKKDAKRIAEMKKNKSQAFRIGILEKRKPTILERHRHRYEVNPEYISRIEEKGLVFSGYHIRKDKAKLMEFIELLKHKFFVATQAHPEFKSRLTDPAPLFLGFIKAAMK